MRRRDCIWPMVDLETAKEPGIPLPPTLLSLADEVIE